MRLFRRKHLILSWMAAFAIKNITYCDVKTVFRKTTGNVHLLYRFKRWVRFCGHKTIKHGKTYLISHFSSKAQNCYTEVVLDTESYWQLGRDKNCGLTKFWCAYMPIIRSIIKACKTWGYDMIVAYYDNDFSFCFSWGKLMRTEKTRLSLSSKFYLSL